MKCPNDNKEMLFGWQEQENDATQLVWVCPQCRHEHRAPLRRWAEQEYLCAFCQEYFHHTHTEDHTPLAKLICPKCAKKMHIELQTHPDEPENGSNAFFGC